ncbi:MAG: BCD family MFS transporter [Anaerolineales bacterium]|nr:BCD family MFS transporter [Chloroflexota bacterium]MBL6980571.1 BCD family MFS transporter [Anaerolineales bacterium]
MKTVARILNNIRLAFFPIAYGLSGALIGGTLNRIMIAELGLPATLVGFFFAVPLLISPIRVWLGYRSDGFPLFGRRREPYIVIGALLIGLGIISAVVLLVNIAQTSLGLFVGGLLAFVLYGIGRNLGHNTFQALLSDRFSGHQKARAITLYEVATLLGLVAGAGGLGAALEEYDPARLLSVAIGVAAVVLALATFAALWQEPRGDKLEAAAEKAREIPFKKVLTDYVFSDPQVRTFFALVFFTFVGTLAQDVLLEPYGALVLNMSVGETTRLTAFWGVGVMIAMLLSGAILVKWLGFMRLMRIGMISSIIVFIGLIVSGLMGNPGLFKGLVFVMGFGTGLAGAGMLTGVISFTTAIRAGMLMGVWGVANMVGHAFGSLMGGGIVDLVRSLTGGNAFAAYGTVFALEVVMLLVALYLSTRLDVEESQAYAEAQILVAAD